MNRPIPPRAIRLLLGPLGLAIAALWGFAEATLFFIIPDVLLSLTAVFSIRRSLLQMLAATLGALAGGTLMFLLAAHGPAARNAVLHVPFVRPAMLERINRDYESSGPVALVKGPMNGIPYKAFAVEAPVHMSLTTFLLISFPARLERFLITAIPFALFGLFLRTRKRNYSHLVIALHLLVWCGVYAIYWSII